MAESGVVRKPRITTRVLDLPAKVGTGFGGEKHGALTRYKVIRSVAASGAQALGVSGFLQLA